MNSPENKLEELLRKIVEAICLKTPTPLVRYIQSEAKFEVQVNAEDQGRCVGKLGKNICAISTIMWFAGLSLMRQPVTIHLLDAIGTGFRAAIPFKANSKWDRKSVGQLIDTILNCIFGDATHAWVIDSINEKSTGRSVVLIRLDPYLQMQCEDPDLVDALSRVIHAAGMAAGALLNVEVEWK